MSSLDRAAFGAALDDAAASLDHIRPRLDLLRNEPAVLIYSYGARGSDLARQLRGAGVRCVIYDNAPVATARAAADGFEITRDLELALPLIIAAGQNQIEIFASLARPGYGLAEALYAFDLRNSYGQARNFTDRIVPDADALFAVYRRLDSACQPAFLEVLLFRASLQVDHLVHRRPVSEMWTPPVSGLDIRSLCDLGAYDGDSLAATKALFPQLERSFTIEPSDAQTPVIAALAERIGVRNTHFTGAAWDRRTRLGATVLPNGMMVLDENLDGDIQTETLDVLLGDEPYDYLKLDVEGAEAKVLSGGVRALRQSKCVAVAGYHLPDDLYDLPNLFDRLLGSHAAEWRLAFGHYSQSFEDSFFFLHRA